MPEPADDMVLGPEDYVPRPAKDRHEAPSDSERIARAFHETYERLAPEHGYETREASAVPWPDLPERNRSLMIAIVADLLARGVIT